MMVNLTGYPGLSMAGEFGAKNYTRESLTADLIRYAYYGVAQSSPVAIPMGSRSRSGMSSDEGKAAGRTTPHLRARYRRKGRHLGYGWDSLVGGK